MGQRLMLIAWSINNVVAALRCLSGAPAGTISFHRPEDPEAFERAWQWDVGVTASKFDAGVDLHGIVPATRAELLQELERRTTGEAA